ncbi:hypothetical protein CBR_g19171 [Chara braunii]|uniref:Reverse transcriptase domain-containing protein n=1 Tax=Chara braunii TaxID=69332 RepID=A0A388JTH6_CHABU|nr:hypothetical protein CBR_g19171 [Chara braunii]|eukprot:GBG61095.1 hypothetical protein CBR_g19171 [Chara braunii]
MCDIEHSIQLVFDYRIHHQAPYRLSIPEATELKRQLEELLRLGFIKPSNSPWGAPVVFARKADETFRLCIDYHGLNRYMVKNNYPMPHSDELFDRLVGNRFFTIIDLCSGCHQIRVAATDQPKTAFRSRFGHYEFTVMSFGLTNAPATFQRAMNDIFRDILEQYILAYLDDILIYSRTLEEHLRHLCGFLNRLRRYGFYAKLSNRDRVQDDRVGSDRESRLIVFDSIVFDSIVFDSIVIDSIAFESIVFYLIVLDSIVLDSIVFDSIVFDSIAFDSIVLDSIVFDSIVFDSIVFDSIMIDSIVFDSIVFDSIVFESIVRPGDRVRLDRVRHDRARLDRARLDRARLDRARLNRVRHDRVRLDRVRVDREPRRLCSTRWMSTEFLPQFRRVVHHRVRHDDRSVRHDDRRVRHDDRRVRHDDGCTRACTPRAEHDPTVVFNPMMVVVIEWNTTAVAPPDLTVVFNPMTVAVIVSSMTAVAPRNPTVVFNTVMVE